MKVVENANFVFFYNLVVVVSSLIPELSNFLIPPDFLLLSSQRHDTITITITLILILTLTLTYTNTHKPFKDLRLLSHCGKREKSRC